MPGRLNIGNLLFRNSPDVIGSGCLPLVSLKLSQHPLRAVFLEDPLSFHPLNYSLQSLPSDWSTLRRSWTKKAFEVSATDELPQGVLSPVSSNHLNTNF